MSRVGGIMGKALSSEVVASWQGQDGLFFSLPMAIRSSLPCPLIFGAKLLVVWGGFYLLKSDISQVINTFKIAVFSLFPTHLLISEYKTGYFEFQET